VILLFQVIRSVHGLLTRLFGLFPPSSPAASGDETTGHGAGDNKPEVSATEKELEVLYGAVAKTITEGLGSYEKATTSSSPTGEAEMRFDFLFEANLSEPPAANVIELCELCPNFCGFVVALNSWFN